eukprot:8253068-Pyramimonas_sp.AAC.1
MGIDQWQQVPGQVRDLGKSYMQFCLAAESFQTNRDPSSSFSEADMHRGFHIDVQQVPPVEAKPQGWLAEASNLSVWSALHTRLSAWVGLVRKSKPIGKA